MTEKRRSIFRQKYRHCDGKLGVRGCGGDRRADASGICGDGIYHSDRGAGV